MTLNCELCQNEFSVSSGRLVIKFPKIRYLCTYVDQVIIQQRFKFLLRLQFYNISTNVLSIIFKLFPDILTIYEPPKIYNKVPKYWSNPCLNNNHLPAQFYVSTLSGFWIIFLLTLLKMCLRGQRPLVSLNFLKKILVRIFFLKCRAIRSLFLSTGCCPYFYNKLCI